MCQEQMARFAVKAGLRVLDGGNEAAEVKISGLDDSKKGKTKAMDRCRDNFIDNGATTLGKLKGA